MALSKVDLSKQIAILQNVWISTCNIFNSEISFLTERQNKRRNTKKKKRKSGLDLEEVKYGGPTF